MKYKSVPLTKAKTAYGLLADVRRRALAVPAAIDMTTVLDKSGTAPCGSVGCIAGECCLLTLGMQRALTGIGCALSNGGSSRLSFAEHLMGLPLGRSAWENSVAVGAAGREAADPFEKALANFFDAGGSDGIDLLTPGTARYAKAVARRITRFMKTHETRLRAFKLKTVLNAAR